MELLNNVMDNRNQKAGLETTLELLALWLTEPMQRKDLIEQLCAELSCKERTIESRLKQIIANTIPVVTLNGTPFYLCKQSKGKEILYSLTNSLST